MSSWPSPQKLSQAKVKRPTLSGTIRTRTAVSGRTSARMPRSGTLKPCARSIELSSRMTGSPFFSVIVDGRKSNFIAATVITFSSGAAATAIAPAAAAPASASPPRERRSLPVEDDIFLGLHRHLTQRVARRLGLGGHLAPAQPAERLLGVPGERRALFLRARRRQRKHQRRRRV